MVDKSIDHTAEAELVADLQRHDHGAFGKFVTQYSGWLKHIARTMLGDQDDAEEVVQEVLLIVWSEIEKFRGDARIVGWLSSIVRNTATNILRRRMKEKVFGSSTVEDFLPHGFGERSRPDLLMERQETAALVQGCMAGLRHDYREILVLRYFEDEALGTIACRLGITDVNARVRQHRACGALRRRLEETRGAI